jgi:hypothetical protein
VARVNVSLLSVQLSVKAVDSAVLTAPVWPCVLCVSPSSPPPPKQKLYFCEYSLHFFKRRTQLLRHLSKCKLRHPPGDEIYRKDNISMFEV